MRRALQCPLNQKSYCRYLCINQKNLIQKQAEEDKLWTKTDQSKQLLNKVMALPLPSSIIQSTDMISYYNQRLNLTQPLTDCEMRFLSSLATFPLTLSHGINSIQQHTYSNNNTSTTQSNSDISCLVIGARAEASLPKLYWKKSLITLKSQQINNLTINMMGMHLPLTVSTSSNSSKSTAALIRPKPFQLSYNYQASDDPHNNLLKRHLTVDNLIDGRCSFHEHPNINQLLSTHNLFVLFNPGYGSISLQSSWEPTIKRFIESKKTGIRPVTVIATAHSLYDLNRDIKQLNILSKRYGVDIEYIIEPILNPYASTRVTYDDREEVGARVVTTNQYIYGFRAL